MSATNDIFWLDDYTTLDLSTPGDGTATPVAGIQNVEIVPNVSMERLYTADSIKIEAQKQHEAAVNVTIGYSKWDSTVAEQWLGGGGDTSANSLTDTSDPQKYELSGTFESQNGDRTMDVTVTGITFEEMPLMAASRGEYVQWDLEGTGEDISDLTITDNTTA
jgi:hypothetical protein